MLCIEILCDVEGDGKGVPPSGMVGWTCLLCVGVDKQAVTGDVTVDKEGG